MMGASRHRSLLLLREIVFGLCVSLAVSCAPTATSGMRDGEFIELRKSNGVTLRIPLRGLLYNKEAVAIAREIQSIDASLGSWRASSKTMDPAVVNAAEHIVLQLRDEAIAELAFAYEVAEDTAGPLDVRSLRNASRRAGDALGVFRVSLPSSVYVKTEITSSVPNAVLHYMSFADHEAKKRSWSSYNVGERMRMGLYVFRVQTPGSNPQVYEEIVSIDQDPKRHQINPVLGA
jgi:hypothetical protein